MSPEKPAKRGGARKGAGRKPKPQIPQIATKGIATAVLGALGTKLKLKVRDENGQLIERYVELPSERDCWLMLLTDKDKRLRLDTMKYLTDKRDGKPAQGVFVGDTRENAPELDFGDLLMPAADQSAEAGKPN